MPFDFDSDTVDSIVLELANKAKTLTGAKLYSEVADGYSDLYKTYRFCYGNKTLSPRSIEKLFSDYTKTVNRVLPTHSAEYDIYWDDAIDTFLYFSVRMLVEEKGNREEGFAINIEGLIDLEINNLAYMKLGGDTIF